MSETQRQAEIDKKAEFHSTFSDDPTSTKLETTKDTQRPKSRLGDKAYRNQNSPQHTYRIPDKLKSNADLRVKALFDFWAFVELMAYRGGCESFADFHKEMADFFTCPQTIEMEKRRRLGLVPRGHLKSTLGTVGYVLWRIYRNENIRIGVGTATKDLATSFIREIKQYLEREDLQEEIWNNRPHRPGRLIPILDKSVHSRRHQKWQIGDTEAQDRKVVWRANAIQVMRSEVMKEPTVVVASTGTNITGMHFDLMILDDIINDDTVATPEKREKTIVWAQDLESIIDPERVSLMGKIDGVELPETIGDELVIWGTRYHQDDYYAFLIENLEDFEYTLFFRNIYKNGKDSSDGYLWGERFNDKVVNRIKKRQGLIRFSSQYLNKVIASEDIIFEGDKINYLPPNIVDLDNSPRGKLRLKFENKLIDISPILAIDPAISQKKNADNTVIAVGGVDYERNFYILDFRCGKMLPNVLIENTYELLDKYKLNAAVIEVVAFQQSLLYSFRQRFHEFRPISLIEYTPKGEKEARIQTNLQPLFYNGLVWMPYWAKTHKEFQEEVNYFPSTHDDILDCMNIIYEKSIPAPNPRKARIRDKFVVNRRYGGRAR